MKVRLFVVLFLIFSAARAQDATGVKFEKGLSWAQVQEKAKKERKYIFLDVYTTWCGPCKLMDRDVFPQENVGEFFNTHFINVKVQADETKKDSEEVREWYRDAQALVTAYNIDSFPTFLFFNPNGELVHRLNGGSPTGDGFIARAEAALSGYHGQKRQYQTGRKDPGFLLELVKSAQLMNDRELIPAVTNDYLATQKNLLTEENLKLIPLSTTKTTDPGFAVLRSNADKADEVLGKGASERIVKAVVFDEIVLPYLRADGARKDYGGMVAYTGKVNESVNWDEVEKELNLQFPDLSEEIMLTSKPLYYQWLKNWPEYVRYVYSHRTRIDRFLLKSYANNVFLFSEDLVSLETALDWSGELLAGEYRKNPHFLFNYANLLYKTGKKEEAVRVMEEAVALSGQEGGHFAGVLDKMKKGEKTW